MECVEQWKSNEDGMEQKPVELVNHIGVCWCKAKTEGANNCHLARLMFSRILE